MSGFGDYEPEDAYDASDPVDERLVVCARIARELLIDGRSGHATRAARRRALLVRLLRSIADQLDDET